METRARWGSEVFVFYHHYFYFFFFSLRGYKGRGQTWKNWKMSVIGEHAVKFPKIPFLKKVLKE